MRDLEDWMRTERARLSRHADVAKAMDYMLKRWAAFTRFLDDGRICLTNNAAERGGERGGVGGKIRRRDKFFKSWEIAKRTQAHRRTRDGLTLQQGLLAFKRSIQTYLRMRSVAPSNQGLQLEHLRTGAFAAAARSRTAKMLYGIFGSRHGGNCWRSL